MRLFIREENFTASKWFDQLKTDFKSYKTTGLLPGYFGRDAPYNHADNPQFVLDQDIRHIHLNPLRKDVRQYDQVSNDAHLVYCQGLINEDHYYLLALLEPNPHELAKRKEIMRDLAIAAHRFRLEF